MAHAENFTSARRQRERPGRVWSRRAGLVPCVITHLVPLPAAVVERRGGLLIHGAIIARELGIPCVNGVASVVNLLRDGDGVTVDG